MQGTDAKALRRAAAGLGIDLTDAQVERIGRHVDLLEVWNQRLRLTGERDRPTLLRKHAVDSLAPLRFLPAAGLVVDIGSGGGFPGLVLATMRPDLSLLLVESRRRPSSFLAEAIRALDLPNVRVRNSRAEDLASDADVAAKAACVVSRAVRLDSLLTLARPLLEPSGIIVSFQTRGGDSGDVGRKHGAEVVDRWDYELPGGEPRRLMVFRPF